MTENEFRAIVRKNIRRYRDYRKWTQAELAEKMDISVNFLSDIENGKRWISPASIVKFAAVLKIEPYELFKPADAQPSSVCDLLNKYNDDVVLAVSSSLKNVYDYYLAFAQTETQTALKKNPPQKSKKQA